MSFLLNWDVTGVTVEFEGTLTFESVMQANDSLLGSAQFDFILYQIWDFQKITEVSIKREDAVPLGTMAKYASLWSKKQYIAILVNLNERNIAFFETFKSFMERSQWQCALFSDKDKVKDWLKSELGSRF